MRFFRRRSDSLESETRQILDKLQCECIIFSEQDRIDEVRDAYKKANKLGKSEGFIPVFIIPDKALFQQNEETEQMVLTVKKVPEELLQSHVIFEKLNCEVIMAKIPVKHPWEVLASFSHISGCLLEIQRNIIEISKLWYESFGAVPAVFAAGSIEFFIDRQFLEMEDFLTHKACYSTLELNTKRGEEK